MLTWYSEIMNSEILIYQNTEPSSGKKQVGTMRQGRKI